MKRNNLATFVLALAAATCLTSPVFAQAEKSMKMTASIPFEFVVAGHTLPAGNYQVQELDSAGAVAILNTNTNAQVLVLPASVAANLDKQTSLVFDRYGDQYFLAKIDGRFHNALSRSSREREVASKRGIPAETALIALR